MNTTITTPAGSVLPADDSVPEKVPAYNQAHLDLEKALHGAATVVNVAAVSSPHPFSAAESRGETIEATGVRASALTAILSPTATPRRFTFYNNGTTQTISVKVTSGGISVPVTSGSRADLKHDGTNVYAVGANPLSGMTTNRIQKATSATTIGDGALSDDGTGIAFVSSSGYVMVSARSQLSSPADGNWLMRNNAATGFGLLQFGGTSSSFPALKRSGTIIQARLADDSGYASFDVAAVTFSGVRATHTSNQLTSTGVSLVLAFGSEANGYDTDSYHDTSTNNSRLTAPRAGYYRIRGRVTWDGSAAGVRVVYLRKNGTDFIDIDEQAVAVGDRYTQEVSEVALLAAGDYVELVALQTSGGNLNVVAMSGFGANYQSSPVFEMSWVGR